VDDSVTTHEGDTHGWGDYINNSSRGGKNERRAPQQRPASFSPLKMLPSDFASFAVRTPAIIYADIGSIARARALRPLLIAILMKLFLCPRAASRYLVSLHLDLSPGALHFLSFPRENARVFIRCEGSIGHNESIGKASLVTKRCLLLVSCDLSLPQLPTSQRKKDIALYRGRDTLWSYTIMCKNVRNFLKVIIKTKALIQKCPSLSLSLSIFRRRYEDILGLSITTPLVLESFLSCGNRSRESSLIIRSDSHFAECRSQKLIAVFYRDRGTLR